MVLLGPLIDLNLSCYREVQNPFAVLYFSFDVFFIGPPHYSSTEQMIVLSNLEYDLYEKTCPRAEEIVRTTMVRIISDHKDVPARHGCFFQGCDASVLLDDGNGNRTHRIEKQAIPNRTLKGFDKIDTIKEVFEKACPGVVSCAYTLVPATRDGVLLSGGPFYPVFTGRRDSIQSYSKKSLTEILTPDGNITEILQFSSKRGNSERTVNYVFKHLFEILIRKKEAMPQPPPAAPVYQMQPPLPHSPPAQAIAPAPAPVLPAPAKTSASSHPPLKCPMAGTFYRCPGPGEPPFVKVGDKVQKGQVICIIEAMKLMNEIEAMKLMNEMQLLAFRQWHPTFYVLLLSSFCRSAYRKSKRPFEDLPFPLTLGTIYCSLASGAISGKCPI